MGQVPLADAVRDGAPQLADGRGGSERAAHCDAFNASVAQAPAASAAASMATGRSRQKKALTYTGVPRWPLARTSDQVVTKLVTADPRTPDAGWRARTVQSGRGSTAPASATTAHPEGRRQVSPQPRHGLARCHPGRVTPMNMGVSPRLLRHPAP